MESSQKAQAEGKNAIRRDMPIAEIVTLCPEAKSVLAEYGLHCFSCAASEFETLEEGCLGHGYEAEDVDELVDDLNAMIERMPARPQLLTLTVSAAQAIRKVAEDDEDAKKEMRDGNVGLAVIAEAGGGFCMEFRAAAQDGEEQFGNAEEPSVKLFASVLTLKRIGGGTIDFRDGRFKLDLPEDAKAGCDCGGSCSCSGGGCGCK
jgi:hybrid cluster-associated redox disulfide protein